jgi:SAM-dependent methyltransferase
MPRGSGDAWADDYERGRPGWPPEVVDLPGVRHDATVLDLGAGTGKLTRLLTPRFDRVVAVEPSQAMRSILAETSPEAELLDATAQSIPLADASVDAVFAAEAFHWFDDEQALDEVDRVLRPAGPLVLMWNVPAGPTEPSVGRAERFLNERAPRGVSYDPLDLDGPQYTSGKWRAGLASRFGPLRERALPNGQTLDRDDLVAFYASMGWIADLPDEDRLPLLDTVRSLLTDDAYRRSWETRVHWADAATR